MRICEYCHNEHDSRYGTGRFCNKICARKFSLLTIETIKSTKCKRCGCDILVKAGTDPNFYFCDLCKKLNRKEQRDNTKIECRCIFCNKIFYHYCKIKICSKICKKSYFSKIRNDWLKRNGTSNFACRIQDYSYGNAHNINLDSKLEQAAIIYLNDVFCANLINRYDETLNFIDDCGITHFFNTDFYVEKDADKYIVEVKMPWIGTSEHIYNKYIPNKKKSLQQHCDERNYKMIWLDLNFDKRFYNIYIDVLSKRIPG